ncbi:unnamed protein product [Rhizopus stolonifer]
MLSRLSSCRSASSTLRQGFHSSATSFAKKHPKQVKKENLAKRAAKLAELERTKPSFIVSQSTPFFNTLVTPAEAYQQHKTGYMHFLDENDQSFLFKETPENTVNASHMAAVDGMESALEQEQSKVETMQKLLSLQNGNAKAVQFGMFIRLLTGSRERKVILVVQKYKLLF